MKISNMLRDLANNEEMMEVGRQAIEDVLVSWRDSRMSVIGRGNGLVVYEADGRASSVIRLGPEMAVAIALRAIANKMESKEDEGSYADVGQPTWGDCEEK